jgi:hypothetical protein
MRARRKRMTQWCRWHVAEWPQHASGRVVFLPHEIQLAARLIRRGSEIPPGFQPFLQLLGLRR